MGNFNLDNYEPVEERIRRFYADHPEGRITADLISDASNISLAVVKAFLYVGETLVSTGLAYEKNGEGYVNKTSHLENCETSAIGRALANYNYAGSKRPSKEEMQKTQQPSRAEPIDEWKALRNEAIELLKGPAFEGSSLRQHFKDNHHSWSAEELKSFIKKADEKTAVPAIGKKQEEIF